MSEPVDLIIHSAGQLCVVPPPTAAPQRGATLGDLGLIADGAAAIQDGRVLAVGPRRRFAPATALNTIPSRRRPLRSAGFCRPPYPPAPG